MKRKHRKIKRVPLLIIAFLLCLVVGTIVYGAMSKRSDSVINSMNVGMLKGELEESDFPKQGEHDDPYKKGEAITKEVNVKNTGNMNLFIRVMVFPEIISKDGILLPSNIGKEVEIDLKSDWVDGEDGYYYYTKKLAPKENSQVFSKVKLSNTLSQDYSKAKLQIQIKSETVTSIGSRYRATWWNKGETEVPTENAYKAIDAKLQAIKDKD